MGVCCGGPRLDRIAQIGGAPTLKSNVGPATESHSVAWGSVGCFGYSPVDGATANELPGALPDEVKEERRARFMEVQAEISEARLRAKIGREIEVIVDDVQDNIAVARSWADAPEIDGMVHVQQADSLKIGDIVNVTVVDTTEHDLTAYCKHDRGEFANRRR